MIKQIPKTLILFSFFTLIFTWVFFILDTFFISKEYNIEEKLIDQSLYLDENIEKLDYLEIAKDILEEKKSEEELLRDKIEKRKKLILEHIEEEKEKRLNSFDTDDFIKIEKINIPQIDFNFIPIYFSKMKNTWKKDIYEVIDNKVIYNFIEDLSIKFYKERPDVRWKMKNKAVHLYAPHKMKKDELLAIFIHEFAHYIDIYSLDKTSWKDSSNEFYNISWEWSSVIKSWLTWKDFVSGYSMTNKYEDFAESLTYYLLHNKDFLKKSKKSIVLKKKYSFFKNFLFSDTDYFINTDFSENNKVKNYYRDITKIEFSTKNFLQYLKKSI